jgi:hypothetical protein
MRSSVLLAQPLGPDEDHELAVADLQVHAVHGLEAVGVGLLDLSKAQRGHLPVNL